MYFRPNSLWLCLNLACIIIQVATLLDTSTEGSPVARMVPFDMVLDPANDILYWSDMTYGTIVMTRIEGSMEHVVFNLGAGDGLRKPKYLALHSDRQFVFFSFISFQLILKC